MMHSVTAEVGDSGCSLRIGMPEPWSQCQVQPALPPWSPPHGGLRDPTSVSGDQLNTAWVTWGQAGSPVDVSEGRPRRNPCLRTPPARARPPPPATQTPKY